MKSERSYPIYKVNKKAEASLVGGHPWVYENDILEFPEAEPENGTLADVVSPKRLPRHRLRLSQEQDPRPPHLPQRQRHLRRQLLAPAASSTPGPTARPSSSPPTCRPAGSSSVRPTSSPA